MCDNHNCKLISKSEEDRVLGNAPCWKTKIYVIGCGVNSSDWFLSPDVNEGLLPHSNLDNFNSSNFLTVTAKPNGISKGKTGSVVIDSACGSEVQPLGVFLSPTIPNQLCAKIYVTGKTVLGSQCLENLSFYNVCQGTNYLNPKSNGYGTNSSSVCSTGGYSKNKSVCTNLIIYPARCCSANLSTQLLTLQQSKGGSGCGCSALACSADQPKLAVHMTQYINEYTREIIWKLYLTKSIVSCEEINLLGDCCQYINFNCVSCVNNPTQPTDYYVCNNTWPGTGSCSESTSVITNLNYFIFCGPTTGFIPFSLNDTTSSNQPKFTYSTDSFNITMVSECGQDGSTTLNPNQAYPASVFFPALINSPSTEVDHFCCKKLTKAFKDSSYVKENDCCLKTKSCNNICSSYSNITQPVLNATSSIKINFYFFKQQEYTTDSNVWTLVLPLTEPNMLLTNGINTCSSLLQDTIVFTPDIDSANEYKLTIKADPPSNSTATPQQIGDFVNCYVKYLSKNGCA